jgi:hypothetical protein
VLVDFRASGSAALRGRVAEKFTAKLDLFYVVEPPYPDCRAPCYSRHKVAPMAEESFHSLPMTAAQSGFLNLQISVGEADSKS